MSLNNYKPTIEHVIACKEGKSYQSKDLLYQLKSREDLILKRLRVELLLLLQDQEPKYIYICGYCRKPVRLRGGQSFSKKQLHFTHAYSNPQCKYHRGELPSREELNRKIYAGLREGPVHQLLKRRLSECLILEGENFKNISNVAVEKNIRIDSHNWKRPDINFEFEDKHVALELQLSSTYLDVIMERHRFYEENKIFMLWIFKDLSLDDAERAFTLDDVIFRNNDNAYVFDDAQYKKSIAEKRLFLRCFYLTYQFVRGNERIKSTWNEVEVTLSDITFDYDNKSLYYYNSVASLSQARQEQSKYLDRKRELVEKLETLQWKESRLHSNNDILGKQLSDCREKIEPIKLRLFEIWESYKDVRTQLNNFVTTVSDKQDIKTILTTNTIPSLASLLSREVDQRKEYRDKITELNKITEANIKRLEELKEYKYRYRTTDQVGLVDITNRFDEYFFRSYHHLLYRRDRLSPVPVKYTEGDDWLFEADMKRKNKGDVFIYIRVDTYQSKIETKVMSDTTEMNKLLAELNHFEANYRSIRISKFNQALLEKRNLFMTIKAQLDSLRDQVTEHEELKARNFREITSISEQIDSLKNKRDSDAH